MISWPQNASLYLHILTSQMQHPRRYDPWNIRKRTEALGALVAPILLWFSRSMRFRMNETPSPDDPFHGHCSLDHLLSFQDSHLSSQEVQSH